MILEMNCVAKLVTFSNLCLDLLTFERDPAIGFGQPKT